jgi:transcriptional regulator with XRE-family HTH domain
MDYLGCKLRSTRRSKRLTLKQLADRASCSPSYLSMVENGKVDPGISRLKRIVDGLEITIVDLFQTKTNQKVITKNNERISAEFPHSRTKIEILIPQSPENQLDARLATIYPGGNSEGEYKHPGEEFGLVLKGILDLVIEGVTYKLAEGDSFHFSSIRNHRFSNPGDRETLVVWVNHPPSF